MSNRLALSESRVLRLTALMVLHACQGIPAGISVIGIPAWVAANGGSSVDVAGLVAAGYLPASFKFLIGPLVDRYTWVPMGRRRPWLILGQTLMIVALLGAALLAPGPSHIVLLTGVIFLVSAGTAVQDVASDGLAVDVLREREQGVASALMWGTRVLFMAGAGAAAGYGFEHAGGPTTLLMFLVPVLLVTGFILLVIERPDEKHLPWTRGEASPVNLHIQADRWWPILREAMGNLFRRDSLIFIGAFSLVQLSAGIATTFFPLFSTQVAGLSITQYSEIISATGVVGAVIAVGLGSWLVLRIGPRRMLIGLSALIALAILPLWLKPQLFTGMLALAALLALTAPLSTLSGICANALRLNLSTSRVGATQMTIYNSLGYLPMALGATLFAALGGMHHLALVLAVALGLTICGMVLFALLRIGDAPSPEEAEDRPLLA